MKVLNLTRTASGLFVREELFWSKAQRQGDCLVWTGATDSSGYGNFAVWLSETKRSARSAHRVAFELVRGEIPEGCELDHLCRNILCIEPAHLDPVPHLENVRRGKRYALYEAPTHCKNGHPFTEENTYWQKGKWRSCRICGREHSRRWKERNK